VLYATGLRDEDLDKPEVGIASVWYEGNPCNVHLLSLAEKVKEGVVAAGLVGMRFNTIGMSDGISMGTDGMSFSLQSRDLIADSIETIMAAQWYDANISIPGCDKNMPGCVMAMGRLNRPSLMVYGGTIRAGHITGHKVDIASAFQSYGEYLSGNIDEQQRRQIIRNACPGAGACGGMYTATHGSASRRIRARCKTPAKVYRTYIRTAVFRVRIHQNGFRTTEPYRGHKLASRGVAEPTGTQASSSRAYADIREYRDFSGQGSTGRDNSRHAPAPVSKMWSYSEAACTTDSHALDTVEQAVHKRSAVESNFGDERFIASSRVALPTGPHGAFQRTGSPSFSHKRSRVR